MVPLLARLRCCLVSVLLMLLGLAAVFQATVTRVGVPVAYFDIAAGGPALNSSATLAVNRALGDDEVSVAASDAAAGGHALSGTIALAQNATHRDVDKPDTEYRTLAWLTEELVEGMEVASVIYGNALCWLLARMWLPFAAVAAVLVPFGKKRPRCDHHTPSLFNAVRRALLGPHPCRGECVVASRYSLHLFWDDLAWSLWVVEVAAWCYVMTLVVSAGIVALGMVVYWVAGCTLLVGVGFAVLLLCFLQTVQFFCIYNAACLKLLFACFFKFGAVLAACLNAAGRQAAREFAAVRRAVGLAWEQMRAQPGADAGGPNDASAEPEDARADPPRADGGRGFELGAGNADGGADEGGDGSGPGRGDGTSADGLPEEDSRTRSASLCGPVCLRVLSAMPIMPENAWGGLVGMCLGTHPLRNTYTGGSRVAELLRMGWRREVDLSGLAQAEDGLTAQEWRELVQQSLLEVAAAGNVLQNGRENSRPLLQGSGVPVGINVREELDRRFAPEDELFNWDQYSDNECWICCSDNETWDLWVSCRHAFCSRCSTQMLSRFMLCPLCRTASTCVVRRMCADRTGDAAAASEVPAEASGGSSALSAVVATSKDDGTW